jgi:hypothetical protein
MAAPSPSQKLPDKENALAGKLNARAALKWVNPAKMIQAIVPITASQR